MHLYMKMRRWTEADRAGRANDLALFDDVANTQSAAVGRNMDVLDEVPVGQAQKNRVPFAKMLDVNASALRFLTDFFHYPVGNGYDGCLCWAF